MSEGIISMLKFQPDRIIDLAKGIKIFGKEL